jgi:uncharacterized protein DUF6886
MTEVEWVYLATGRGGVSRFEPRPFWRSDDYSRSGSAVDPGKVPTGAIVFHGVYATRESFVPFYFPPRHCPRLSLDPRENQASLSVLRRHVGPMPPETPRVILFARGDRENLDRFEFSVYAFDAAHFRRLPTGEFLSETSVEPVREKRRRDAIASIEHSGWAVRFLPDADAIRSLRTELIAAGVTRFSAEKLGV